VVAWEDKQLPGPTKYHPGKGHAAIISGKIHPGLHQTQLNVLFGTREFFSVHVKNELIFIKFL
jgi:hypothetical protein